MMTEWERMVAGEIYFPGDTALLEARQRARVLCRQYNDALPEEDELREEILHRLLGSVGKDCWIEPTLRCDYGCNITVGDTFYANYDCVFLDAAPSPSETTCWWRPGCAFIPPGIPLPPPCGIQGWNSPPPSPWRTMSGSAAT